MNLLDNETEDKYIKKACRILINSAAKLGTVVNYIHDTIKMFLLFPQEYSCQFPCCFFLITFGKQKPAYFLGGRGIISQLDVRGTILSTCWGFLDFLDAGQFKCLLVNKETYYI